MCRIVSFVSGSGGVGQTSLIYSLSKMLSEKNFRVCVFDGHFNLNVISLKYNSVEEHDLMEYIAGNLGALEVLCSENAYLKFVKCNCITFNYLAHFELIKAFILELANHFDYILIDANSNAKKQLSLALECSNEAILILSNELCSIRSGAKILQKIYFYENILSVNIVLNKIRVIAEICGNALGEKEISEIFKIAPLFVFPKFYKNNIFENKKAGTKTEKMLYEFCESFLSNERIESDYKKQYSGLIGYFRRKFYEKYE